MVSPPSSISTLFLSLVGVLIIAVMKIEAFQFLPASSSVSGSRCILSSPSIKQPTTTSTTVLFARKKKGSRGGGAGFGSSPSKGGAANSNNNPNEPPTTTSDEDIKEPLPVLGESMAKSEVNITEDFRDKMTAIGANIEKLAAQAAAQEEEEDDGLDAQGNMSPAFIAEQKRLREALDFERPYVRDKPRNWDYITGLPVPKRVKIEQVFPIPSQDIRQRYREAQPNDPVYMANRIKEIFTEEADKEDLRSWYIANRDWLNQGTRLLLAVKSLRASYDRIMPESKAWLDALKVYRMVECSVTCHLQQAMREAEIRLSQNLGNFDMTLVAGNTPAERACMWITLKAVLAKWETRREKYTSLPVLSMQQERALAGTRKVVQLFQRMNLAYSECEPVMRSLPLEMVYLDKALGEASGTELRRWTIKVFCPAAGVAIEELRERIRSLTYILQGLPHAEMAELNAKLCEIYRAIALGTAEFETEVPLDLILATLPPDTADPEAPYPFHTEDRLDASKEVDRITATTPSDKIDVVLKQIGIPFPESPKITMNPKEEADYLWFDNWAYAWGQEPKDWYPEPIVPESQRLSGTFTQDFIDKMHRAITARKRGSKQKAFGMPIDGEEDDAVIQNPITLWNDEQAEKTAEEKEAVETFLKEEREKNLKAFQEAQTYWDEDGKTILTYKQAKEKYFDNPNWRPPSYSSPKELLEVIQEQNARWAEMQGRKQVGSRQK